MSFFFWFLNFHRKICNVLYDLASPNSCWSCSECPNPGVVFLVITVVLIAAIIGLWSGDKSKLRKTYLYVEIIWWKNMTYPGLYLRHWAPKAPVGRIIDQHLENIETSRTCKRIESSSCSHNVSKVWHRTIPHVFPVSTA